jgi:uncharacterized protein YukE
VIPAIALAPLALAVALTVVASSAPRSDQRAAFATYANAAATLAKDGGRIVVEGIKPRLADLYASKVSVVQFVSEAQRWHQEIEHVRRAFAHLRAPKALRPAARRFDEALHQYERAIDAFSDAAKQPADRVKSAMTSATPVAQAADALWDQAEALVETTLRRWGLTSPFAAPIK